MRRRQWRVSVFNRLYGAVSFGKTYFSGEFDDMPIFKTPFYENPVYVIDLFEFPVVIITVHLSQYFVPQLIVIIKHLLG